MVNYVENCNYNSTQNSNLKQPHSKNTGAWKGRLKRFFIDPYAGEIAKNGTNII